MEKRESVSWWLNIIWVLAAGIVAYIAWHSDFAKLSDVIGNDAALLMIIKDDKRVRLKHYEQIEDPTPLEVEQKIILKHDIRNIDRAGRTLGLDMPEEEEDEE